MVNATMLNLVLTLSTCVVNAQVAAPDQSAVQAALAAPACVQAISEGQAIAQSASYWLLIEYGRPLPTQLNPLYVIWATDNRGTWTNAASSSRPAHAQ